MPKKAKLPEPPGVPTQIIYCGDKVIIPLTVREILDEEIAMKLA